MFLSGAPLGTSGKTEEELTALVNSTWRANGLTDAVIRSGLASYGIDGAAIDRILGVAAVSQVSYTIDQINEAIRVTKSQGASDADIINAAHVNYGFSIADATKFVNDYNAAHATKSVTYTATQIADAIKVSREQGFTDADILIGLQRYGLSESEAIATLAQYPRMQVVQQPAQQVVQQPAQQVVRQPAQQVVQQPAQQVVQQPVINQPIYQQTNPYGSAVAYVNPNPDIPKQSNSSSALPLAAIAAAALAFLS